MKFTPLLVFIILCVLFLTYSFSIYLNPLSIKADKGFQIQNASEGKLVWQKYNCQSCHQLYSLGGYLGPDLTNIMSNPNKGEAVVKAMFISGTKQMPAFHLTETEMNSLIAFLKSTDVSGNSDPRKLKTNKIGMIERK
jgi:nitric oxide reductase subunit C